MKNHSASLKPTHGMDASAQTLNLQSDVKAAELNDLVFRDYSQSLKNWSITPTPVHLATFGEGLVKAVYDQHHFYKARRNEDQKFQVIYVGNQNKTKKSSCGLSYGDTFMDVPLSLLNVYGK